MKQKTKIRNLKNNKGITLIALVITVIVLIILGGVSVSMVLTNNGIITKAKDGKEDYTKAQIEEEMFLLISDYRIQKSSNSELTLLDYLNSKKENNNLDDVVDNGDGTIKVIKNGYYVLINKETLTTTEPVLVDGTIVDEDREAPTAKFEIANTTIFGSAPITADLKITDDKSGVKLDSCKWVVVANSEEIGLDETLYTGGTLTSETQQIVADSITDIGEYYIHLLLVDNMNNKREVISEKIAIRDGYGIATAQDFQNMKNDLAGNYYVTKDIDMTGFEFNTINGTFTGLIDGQGHTITGLTINSSLGKTGIFTNVNGATIKDIILKDVNVSSTSSYVGTVSGSTTGDKKIYFEKVGITGEISGTSRIGSFIGSTSDEVEFKDCYARTNITGTGEYDSGGFLTDYQYNQVTITNSYYSGTINAIKRVGPLRGGASINNNSNQYTGYITVTDCFYNKDLFTLSVPEASAGKGLTTGEMANSANYTNWDFKENDQDTEYTWYIDPETGYPELHF